MNPINYDINITPKSQDLPNIVSLNFAITIIHRQTMIKRKNVVGYSPSFFELDKVEALDIDDMIDFKVAELMYQGLRTCCLENVESIESNTAITDELHNLVNNALFMACPEVNEDLQRTKDDLDYAEYLTRRDK